MFPEWTWVVGFWLGAVVGSFLNAVVYRLPRGLSLAEPTFSFCPSCKHRLTIPDLVPILSWVFLRGRCRHCRAPIGARYMAVELANGAVWAAVWHQQLVAGWDPVRAFGFALFGAALIAAIATDLQFYIIPDQVNAFMFVVGVAMNVAFLVQGRPEAWAMGIPSALAGGLVGIGVLWGIALLGRLLFQKDAMGHGDIKMARGIGAVLLAPAALGSFALAVVLGAILGAAQVAARAIQERKRPSPPEAAGEEEFYEPESIGSLFKCGLGYVLCMDIVGLYRVKLYEWWFGENPRAIELPEDEAEVGRTMIPFGPYLALGAIIAMLAEPQLRGFLDLYLDWAMPSP